MEIGFDRLGAWTREIPELAFFAHYLKRLQKRQAHVRSGEVEEILATHPAVAEVAVAGVPDTKQGEAVKAWVVLRAGQSASVEELRAYCHERLAPYKVPRHIAFRDSLPKTQVGKVLRRQLTREG